MRMLALKSLKISNAYKSEARFYKFENLNKDFKVEMA